MDATSEGGFFLSTGFKNPPKVPLTPLAFLTTDAESEILVFRSLSRSDPRALPLAAVPPSNGFDHKNRHL